MQLSKIITVTQINESLQKGDSTLYKERFGFGKDNDINEFSSSLEKHGLHVHDPYRANLEHWMEVSAQYAEFESKIRQYRDSERANDERIKSYSTSLIDAYPDMEASRENYNFIHKKLLESLKFSIKDHAAYEQITPIEYFEELTRMGLFLDSYFSLYHKFTDTRYISTNEVTLLENSFTSNKDLKFLNRTVTIGHILDVITNSSTKKLSKDQRPQLYFVMVP
jgi:hypothetical protein